jgi:hypothetical protein
MYAHPRTAQAPRGPLPPARDDHDPSRPPLARDLIRDLLATTRLASNKHS